MTNDLKPHHPDVPAVVEDPVISMIERVALDPNADIDKLERLLDMQERIVAKQEEGEFNTAMSEAQSEMLNVVADKSNTQTKSKYASYAQLDRSIRPVYTKHGFSLSFDTGEGAPENYVRVICHLSHRGGFKRQYHADIPADGKGAKGGDVMTKTHAAGSAYSYGQRYLLKLMFNVAVGDDDDDDGNKAGDTGAKISAEQKTVIIEKIKSTGVDVEKLTARFLRRMGVPYLDELPASKYFEAIGVLADVKPAVDKQND